MDSGCAEAIDSPPASVAVNSVSKTSFNFSAACPEKRPTSVPMAAKPNGFAVATPAPVISPARKTM